MKRLFKCDECDEEFYIFIEDEECEFCPTCNSGNIRLTQWIVLIATLEFMNTKSEQEDSVIILNVPYVGKISVTKR